MSDLISRKAAIDQLHQSYNLLDAERRLEDLPSVQSEPCEDAVSRQAAIDTLRMDISIIPFAKAREYVRAAIETIYNRLEELPSAQPEPYSYACMKAVWTWLLNYQIKAAELKGRYTPYEVLSWVANDWRKEHE